MLMPVFRKRLAAHTLTVLAYAVQHVEVELFGRLKHHPHPSEILDQASVAQLSDDTDFRL